MQTKINSQTWNFQNSYIELPARLYMKQLPIAVKNPQIIYFNMGLAKELGLEFLSKDKIEVVEYFSGNKIPEGATQSRKLMLGTNLGILLCLEMGGLFY